MWNIAKCIDGSPNLSNQMHRNVSRFGKCSKTTQSTPKSMNYLSTAPKCNKKKCKQIKTH